MKYRRLYIVSLLIVVIMVGGMTLANYIADPYGIFRKDFSYQFLEPDRLFNKARYIGKNPDKYDCFVFGSSRVNSIDVTKIKDATCYNMTYPLGVPGNHLENIRYFLKEGVKIKLLIVGVDEFSFILDAKEYVGSTMGLPYPPVVGERVFPAYLKYLVTTYRTRMWKAMLKGYSDRRRHIPNPAGFYDQFVTGRTFNPAGDRFIDERPEEHTKGRRFKDPTRWDEEGIVLTHNGDKHLVVKTLRDLQEIVSVAREHQIRLIIFMNPIYAIKFHPNDRPLTDFKRQMASITDFYDFTGWNSINTNALYYYEPNHYRSATGDLILARIFHYNPPAVPSDFGILVTRNNVDEHLANLEKQVGAK